MRSLKSAIPHPDFEFSDDSGSWGCGAAWESHWFQVQWTDWPGFSVAEIAANELLPIILAVAVWGRYWFGKAVRCHCDNKLDGVIAGINNGAADSISSIRHDKFFHISPQARRVPEGLVGRLVISKPWAPVVCNN